MTALTLRVNIVNDLPQDRTSLVAHARKITRTIWNWKQFLRIIEFLFNIIVDIYIVLFDHKCSNEVSVKPKLCRRTDIKN